jgi:hypothetical protein
MGRLWVDRHLCDGRAGMDLDSPAERIEAMHARETTRRRHRRR